jgi:hypothetical protein
MIKFFIGVLALTPCVALAYQEMTDDQIRNVIIQESIARYPGHCPCPYNLARNGTQCGGRSAYSKAGGYSPICYQRDVSPAMISNFKRRNKLK